ncbi:MAG TPA: GTPase HflX [Candidatus Limnocylindria bacterium]|nr:GTPase HflX [Candidatus Limnocylindria bacterium]
MKSRLHTTARAAERAVLVGAERPGAAVPSAESLQELGRLADTAGLRVVGSATQALRRPDPATFIGRGKVTELRALRDRLPADVVVFDDALSPAQQRNLERELGCKVIDRSALILDIFAQRARSTEGKLQVELAQLEYLLPRLTRQWTHLSRLGGGVGTRGPGETQLEVDRRRVRERVGLLKRRLAAVERTRTLHREQRAAVPAPIVALVGYTNAGKSTLMRRLTGADVHVEDRLFATLDPTTRRLPLPGGVPALMVDTVGFIHKLPHQLIEAFKSTLEQVATATVLLHVVDVSHARWREHVRIVDGVLQEIGADRVPTWFVFNKIDAGAEDAQPTPAELEHGTCVSALHGDGIEALRERIEGLVATTLVRVDWAVPLGRGDVVAALRGGGRVVAEQVRDGHLRVTALVPPTLAGRLRKQAPEIRNACN